MCVKKRQLSRAQNSLHIDGLKNQFHRFALKLIELKKKSDTQLKTPNQLILKIKKKIKLNSPINSMAIITTRTRKNEWQQSITLHAPHNNITLCNYFFLQKKKMKNQNELFSDQNRRRRQQIIILSFFKKKKKVASKRARRDYRISPPPPARSRGAIVSTLKKAPKSDATAVTVVLSSEQVPRHGWNCQVRCFIIIIFIN